MTPIPSESAPVCRRFARWETLALAGILLIGAALRFIALDRNPLWWDEGNNAYFAQASLGDLLRLSRLTLDTNPPAHRLALKVWLSLWGEGVFSLRSLSAVCGILTIGLVFLWGRWRYGTAVGLVAAALAAIWPMALYHQREAKGYAWVTFFLALSVYLWQKYLDEAPRWRFWPWVGASVSAALALGAHYYAALFIAAQGVGLALLLALSRTPLREALKRWGRWASVQAVAVLAVSPWVVLTLKTSLHGAARLPDVASGSTLALAQEIAKTIAAGGATRGWVAWVAFGAMAATALFALWRSPARGANVFLLTLVLVPPLLGLVAQRYVAFVPARFFTYVIPPLAILLGEGLCRLGKVALLPALVIALAWGTALPEAYRPQAAANEDLRPIAQALRQEARPGDGLLVTYIWEEGILRMLAPDLPIRYHLGWFEEKTVGRDLEGLLATHRRLWLLSYEVPLQHPSNTGGWWLEHHTARAFYLEHVPYSLALYVSPLAQTHFSPTAIFEGGVALESFGMPESVEAGDILPVTLSWAITRAPAPAPTVFVHFVDEKGTLWCQQDGWPHNGLTPFAGHHVGERIFDPRALRIPAEAPEGTYRVLVGLYNPETGRRYRLIQGERAGEDALPLGTVRVVSRCAE